MASEALLSKARAELAGKYAGLGGQKAAALDPALLDLLLELGITVVKKCLAGRGSTPQSVSETARRPGLLARLSVRREVRAELVERHGIGAWRRYDGDRVADALLQAAATATPEELEELAETQL
jgi:hypothetical protein